MVTCALCRRAFPAGAVSDPQAFQQHHLLPERRDTSPTVTLCRPCHDQIHAVFTNDELREEYNTISALAAAGRLDGYLEWIRGTAKLSTDVTTSNHVRRRR